MIPVERLFEMFDLREDGTLVRKTSRGGERAGTAVGCPDRHGYLTVRIERKNYFVHRVVFAMANGRWSEELVDHIDGSRSNNRPENLREANKSQNGANSFGRRVNKTGFKGVHFHKASGLYLGEVSAGGKRVFRKYFKTARDAAAAVVLESLEHHGEFSPFWSRTA